MLLHRLRGRILLLSSIFILAFKFPGPWLWSSESLTNITVIKVHRTKVETAKTEIETPQACKIPEVDLYHKSIKRFIKPPRDPECLKSSPLYFNSTMDFELIPAVPLTIFNARKIESCCYRTVSRAKQDLGYKLSELCHPVSLEKRTKVDPGHEYIGIFCVDNKRPRLKKNHSRLVDVHSFIPLKPEVEQRLDGITVSGDRPNLILLGIDAVSRANFQRWLPRAHKFLTEDMGAIDMQGYNKVGDNTLANIIPLLTSRSRSNLSHSSCVNKQRQLDGCPFIWKDFARRGYRTAFDEDSTWGIFNIQSFKGFEKQPTDYYLRPYNHLIEEHFRVKKTGKKACSGPRYSFEEVLSHMTKLSYTMNKLGKPFFYFSWESTLTHDDVNEAALVEEPLLKSLKWLKENDRLSNTILIVFSDHGMRVGTIRNLRQGQIEDRLPFMYLVFPQWFQEKYPRAIENLQRNRKRLTTILDLNYALHDILNLDSLQDDALQERETQLQNDFKFKSMKGISLFLPIPPERTCKHTMIDSEFCICTLYKPVNSQTRDVRSAIFVVLRSINLNLLKHKKCAMLELDQIKLAQSQKNVSKNIGKRYLINFQTKPGGAQFEALVSNGPKPGSYSWKVEGSVLRTNMYRNQSWCVDDFSMKPYCFCKK